MVLILRHMEDKPPEFVMALLPSLVRTMLAAFVEVVEERRRRRHDALCSSSPRASRLR